MKTYKMEVLEINNNEISNIMHEYGSNCLGLGNDCYFPITFYNDGKEDNWGLEWVTDENIKKVEKWIDKNGLSRDKEYLIHRCW